MAGQHQGKGFSIMTMKRLFFVLLLLAVGGGYYLYQSGMLTKVMGDAQVAGAEGKGAGDKKGGKAAPAKKATKEVEEVKEVEESPYIKEMKEAIKVEKSILRFRLV